MRSYSIALKRILSAVIAVALLLSLYPMHQIIAAPGLGEKFTVTLVNVTDNTTVTNGLAISAGQVVDGRINDLLRWNGEDYAVQKVYVQDSGVTYNIESLEYVPAQNGDEARVYLKLKDVPQDRAKLYYPVSQSDKIKLGVYPVAKVAYLTYAVDPNTPAYGGYDSQDIQIFGPETAQIANGTAKARFVVSVPRQMRPTVTLQGGAPNSVTKVDDLSVVKEDGSFSRTIWVFELSTTASTTVTASWQVKENVTVKGAEDKKNKHDWQQGYWDQDGYQFPDHAKLSEIQKADGSGVETGNEVTRPYNSTVFYNIYHDKTFSDVSGSRGWLTQRSGYNVFLAGVHINGQTFGAPQPFSRFGQSKYKTGNTPGGEGNRQYMPHYSAYPGANDDNNGKHLNIPGVIDIFAQSTGWGPWWASGGSWGAKRKFYDWYYNEVMVKGLQNDRAIKQQYVETGPLAGSSVSLYLVDAKPAKYKGPLASVSGFNRTPTVAEEYANSYANNPAIKGRGQNDYLGEVGHNWASYADGSQGSKAFWNSFRTKYALQINNVRDDIDLDTEWFTTDITKLGLYKNSGVENVEVFVKRLEYGDGNFSGPTQWIKIKGGTGDSGRVITGEGTYIDSRALDGTVNWNNKGKFNNTDPVLKIRGDVINGYIDPRYVDDTTIPAMGGDDWMIPYKDSGANGGGRGFYGEYPLFATGVVNLLDNNNDVFTYGGMNISGIQANLVPIKAGFDLRDGTITNADKFPSVDTVIAAQPEDPNSRLFTFDVNANPVIHLPLDTPTKEGYVFKGWRVHTSRGDSTIFDRTNLLLQPGMDLNIDRTASERNSAFVHGKDGQPDTVNGVVVIDKRISDITGRLNFNKIKFEAEWTKDNSELGVPGIYRVEQSFKDAPDATATTKPALVFRGLPGMKVDFTDLALGQVGPKTITQGEGASEKTYTRVLSDEEWKKKQAESFTLASSTTPVLTVEYVLRQTPENEKFAPAGGTITLPVGTELTAAHAKSLVTFPADTHPDNAQAQPDQYTYAFKQGTAPAVGDQTPGNTPVTVTVTYSDSTTEDVSATITFISQADHWKNTNGELAGQTQTFKYAHVLSDDDKKSLISTAQQPNLPQGVTISVTGVDTQTTDPANAPKNVEEKTLHEQAATVSVQFPDGSTLSAPVVVNVMTAATTFTPSAATPIISFSLGEKLEETVANTDPAVTKRQQAASSGVTFPKTNDGSPYVLPVHRDGYTFKDPISTATSNAPNGVDNWVLVHYQDESIGRVKVKILVESQSDIWKRENKKEKLTGVATTFDYGHTVTPDEIKALVAEKDTLTDATINVAPTINTTPDAGGHTQPVTATATFTDRSTLSSDKFNVTIRTAADTFTPAMAALTVDYNGAPTDQELKASITDASQPNPKNLEPEYITSVTLKPGSTFDATDATETAQPVTYVVTYKDGTTDEVNTTITVRNNSQKTQFTPVVEPLELPYGATIPDLSEQITNRHTPGGDNPEGTLPNGTTFTDDKTGIDTMTPGDYTGRVTVTYPDGSSEVVIVPVKVKQFVPVAAAPITLPFGSTPTDEDAAKTIKPQDENGNPLPNGTTITFKETPNTSKPGPQTVTVTVTFPNGDAVDVPVTVNIEDEATTWEKNNGALTGQDQTFKYGHVMTDRDERGFIRDATKLPEGATVAVAPKVNTMPMTPAGREQAVKVTVTFSDRSTRTVDAKALIGPASDYYQPKPKGIVVDQGSELGAPEAEEAIVTTDDKGDPLFPEGTRFDFKDPVDTSTPGDKEAIVVITYPDGSSVEVPVTVTVDDEATTWEKNNGALEGQDQTFPYGSEVTPDDERGFVKKSDKLPEGATVAVAPKVNTMPTSPAGREQAVKVTVTFSDGSKRTVDAKALIGPASDYYQPKPKGIVVDQGSELGAPEAEEAIVTTDDKGDPLFPEGTRFDFKDPVDTSTPGDKEAIVVITYPDGSSSEITVNVHVNTDAEKFMNEYPDGLETQDQTFPYGHDLTDDDRWNFILGHYDLPEGTRVELRPEVNTKPSSDDQWTQQVDVVLVFPDGSTITAPANATIEKPAHTPDSTGNRTKIAMTGADLSLAGLVFVLGGIGVVLLMSRRRFSR